MIAVDHECLELLKSSLLGLHSGGGHLVANLLYAAQDAQQVGVDDFFHVDLGPASSQHFGHQMRVLGHVFQSRRHTTKANSFQVISAETESSAYPKQRRECLWEENRGRSPSNNHRYLMKPTSIIELDQSTWFHYPVIDNKTVSFFFFGEKNSFLSVVNKITWKLKPHKWKLHSFPIQPYLLRPRHVKNEVLHRSMPEKSEPMPTWSTPATSRMWSMWSTTSPSVPLRRHDTKPG